MSTIKMGRISSHLLCRKFHSAISTNSVFQYQVITPSPYSTSSSENAQLHAYEHYYRRSNDSSSYYYDRNIHIASYAIAAAIGALGATYASVPLYKLFCQRTGFGGTTQRVTFSNTTTTNGISHANTWTDEDAVKRLATLRPVSNSRLLTINFDSTVDDTLPWSFRPAQPNVKVVPGETALAFYTTTNHSDKAITGVATYNVHPPRAGTYFHKIQCFCFEEQRLLPGETVDMPVFFYVDPDFLEDTQLGGVWNVTLSYMFFRTDMDEDIEEEISVSK